MSCVRRMSFVLQEHSHASPQKPLSRSCADDPRYPAQAVREIVAGHHINAVSEAFHLANSALRKWVQRFAQEGPQGLLDRPRSGRPPKITCELEQHLNRLVDQDPLPHGALSSQWSCRELATVLAQQTGVQLGRESIRCTLKKQRSGKRLKP